MGTVEIGRSEYLFAGGHLTSRGLSSCSHRMESTGGPAQSEAAGPWVRVGRRPGGHPSNPRWAPWAMVAMGFHAANFDPHLYFAFRKRGGADRAMTTHIADTLGRGERDIFDSVRRYSERRCGALRSLGKNSARVGAEWPQDKDSSEILAQREFTQAPQPIPTSPALRASRCVNDNWGSCASW